MQHNKIRKVLSALVIIFGLLASGTLVMWLGGGGVLNDLYSALEEIEDLEKKNLLENPPGNISSIAKREIKLVHNSAGLKQYIKENEKTVVRLNFYLSIFSIFFFLSVLLRIYFKKKKRMEGSKTPT